MRTLLNILTLLTLTINFASGQTMNTTLQTLINNKLIEQKQIKEFERYLNKEETKSNSTYLSALFQSEYKKLTGQDYSQFGGAYLSFGEEKLKTNEQNKINEELTLYLSRLKSSNLINTNQFEHFISKINQNDFVHILQFLAGIIEKVTLKEDMNLEKLKIFADKLKSKEIVSNNYGKLITSIEQEKLENPIDFLTFCNKAVIINEKDYPSEPDKYLELIHKKTASIIPDLTFTNFDFKIILNNTISDKDSKFYDFVVSIDANGKKYKQKSSYHLYSPSKNQYYGNKIDQQEYYKIFNKILADLQSPYRLHEVKAYDGNAVDWKTFGIIALTKEQADLLHGGGVYFSPSYESFKNKITSKKIEQAIEEYKKIGLLSHLTDIEIKKAKESVSEQENNNLNSVLMSFPNVIYIFDMELGNLKDPYAELIKEFSKISHLDFNPNGVSDNFDIAKNKKVTIKFKIGSKSYSKTLKITDDWMDVDFFGFIDLVIKENKLKGQFYSLHTGGQEASTIYLTKEQHEYLRTNQLLMFGDDSQPEDE